MMKIDILASKLFNAECEGKQSEFRHITIQALMDTTGNTVNQKEAEHNIDRLIVELSYFLPISVLSRFIAHCDRYSRH